MAPFIVSGFLKALRQLPQAIDLPVQLSGIHPKEISQQEIKPRGSSAVRWGTT